MMNVLSVIIVIFSILGALDYVLNNRFGIGNEWEKGFHLIGTMSLSMIGMIVLAPWIGELILNGLGGVVVHMPFDISVIAGSLLANDMGGATLALNIARDEQMGYYNGLIVGAMMGATISFTLPFAMSVVEKRQQHAVLFGLLCGIVAIPVGCFVAGMMTGIAIVELLVNLIPLIVLAILLSIGLMKIPDMCVKVFGVLTIGIKIFIIFGIVVGIVRFLTGYELIPSAAPIEEGVLIVFNVAVVMSGTFPMLHIIRKLLQKPLDFLGSKMGLNETSTIGFISTLATSVTTFGMMKDMDERGVILNSAFAVSGAFVFADHLAFTMSFEKSFVISMIVGKLVGGLTAIMVACFICSLLSWNEKMTF